jgi:protein-tyrosine kinase
VSIIESALKKLHINSPKAASAESAAQSQTVPLLGELQRTVGAQQSQRRIKVNREALRASGLLPPEMQQRQLATQYRRIKRPLLANALGQGATPVVDGRLILVASALPGEGKSFTTMNLALSMALEKDITVLLVDADLAKPHVSRTFGVQDEPGLIDALQNQEIDVESLVIPTDIPGLSVLPAGKHVETATEFLASSRMREVVARLCQADGRRVSLFDSPPLLLTAESRVLTEVVGQVVVVVRADTTARQAVLDALSLVADNKEVSMILNQSSGIETDNYYGYGEYGVDQKESA